MKFSDLSFKQKIEHIFEYYKIHIAVVVFIIIAVVYLLDIYFIHPRKEVVLDLTIRCKREEQMPENYNSVESAVRDKISLDEKKEDILIEYLPSDNNKDMNVNIAYETKFLAKNDANELDVIILDEDMIYRFDTSKNFYDITNLVSEDIVNSYQKIQDNDRVIAIGLESNDLLSKLVLEPEKYYLCVSASSENIEKVKLLLNEY